MKLRIGVNSLGHLCKVQNAEIEEVVDGVFAFTIQITTVTLDLYPKVVNDKKEEKVKVREDSEFHVDKHPHDGGIIDFGKEEGVKHDCGHGSCAIEENQQSQPSVEGEPSYVEFEEMTRKEKDNAV